MEGAGQPGGEPGTRPALTPDELRRRAGGGAAILISRGALILVVGVGANIVLARLLEPRDFGIVALGTVLLTVSTFISDGGLGTGLIRRHEPPVREELEAVNAAQLGGTAALTIVAFAVAIPLGRDALVVATMIASLPVTILRVPSVILLERELDYRPIARVDVLEAGVFYAWSVTTVALGMGVWGMATGVLVRSVCGTAAMARVGPIGLVRPRWSREHLAPLVRFGAKFQSNTLLALAREQGINVAIAAIAGVSTLGYWSLARRVLQAPQMIFATLNRINFPLMARLLGAGEDPRSALERGSATLAVGAGALLVVVAGLAPALPVLVGPGWGAVPSVILWASLAMLFGYPVVLITSGYLFAADAAGSVVAATATSTAVWFAVALPLLPELGASAAAVGWLAGTLVQAAMLMTRTRATSGAAIISTAGPALAIAAAATAGAWIVTDVAGGSIPAALGGIAAGEAFLLAAVAVASRSALRDARGILRIAIAGLARGRSTGRG